MQSFKFVPILDVRAAHKGLDLGLSLMGKPGRGYRISPIWDGGPVRGKVLSIVGIG